MFFRPDLDFLPCFLLVEPSALPDNPHELLIGSTFKSTVRVVSFLSAEGDSFSSAKEDLLSFSSFKVASNSSTESFSSGEYLFAFLVLLLLIFGPKLEIDSFIFEGLILESSNRLTKLGLLPETGSPLSLRIVFN